MARLSDLVRQQKPVHRGGGAWLGRSSASPTPLRAIGPSRPAATTPADTVDWYQGTQEQLTRLAGSIKEGSVPDIGEFCRLAGGIVTSLEESDGLLRQLLSGSTAPQLVSNAIHVAILSTKIGMALKYPKDELVRLALAGLLHDVGMFSVPDTVINRSVPLTPEERALIEQHPATGADILRGIVEIRDWLPEVAMQEHERWGGQGYPKKLCGPNIHPYAQIIGIADTFDALISPRPYRRQLMPHEAMCELVRGGKRTFSNTIIKTLVDQLAMYPLGTRVRLNTGEAGVVTQLNPGQPLRPIVEICAELEGATGEPKVVDLSTSTALHVVAVVKPTEGEPVGVSEES